MSIQKGDIYNFLTVLGLDEKRNKREKERIKNREIKSAPLYYSCQCVCNRIVSVTAYNLTHNKVKSCGCKRSQLNRNHNSYRIMEDYVIGYSNTDNSEFYFDREDFALVAQYSWWSGENGYITTSRYDPLTKKDKKIRLHKLLVDYPLVDHIDKNKRNNRKSNLRAATHSQNQLNVKVNVRNTSGVTGVAYISPKNAWQATITIEGKKIYLIQSKDKEKAIKARLEAEKKYCGEFAPQRHLFAQYGINEDEE